MAKHTPRTRSSNPPALTEPTVTGDPGARFGAVIVAVSVAPAASAASAVVVTSSVNGSSTATDWTVGVVPADVASTTPMGDVRLKPEPDTMTVEVPTGYCSVGVAVALGPVDTALRVCVGGGATS